MDRRRELTPEHREYRKRFLVKYFAAVCDRLFPYLGDSSSHSGTFLSHRRLEGCAATFKFPGRPFSRVRLLLTLTLPENLDPEYRNVGVTLSWKRWNNIPKKVSEWTNESPSGTAVRIIGNVFLMLAYVVSDPNFDQSRINWRTTNQERRLGL